MFISVTVKTGQGTADIQIDSEQKIGTGLQVLRESGRLSGGESPDFFRSRINEMLVSAHRTFSEEGVYDGDILEAVEGQNIASGEK